ncbi:MAG TPA: GNAT family N-acetyltransferase [Thermoanaerobaculia bacterium]
MTAGTHRRTPGSATDLLVRPLDEPLLDEALAVLEASLGAGFTRQWYRWKHLDNPWGRSLGWVALDAEGVVGVRLVMRWRLAVDGQTVAALRPVDTATAERARRRGVFRLLARTALGAAAGEAEILFNTPNEQSAPGYAALGWTLSPLAWRVSATLPFGRGAAVAEGDEALAGLPAFEAPAGRLATDADAAYLRWRYAAGWAAERGYRLLRLREADAPSLLVYRAARRGGLRLLTVLELLGPPAERRALVRTAARREHAAAVLALGGSGARPAVGGASLRRGRLLLAVRPLAPLLVDPARIDAWALGGGDVEAAL